MTSKLEEAQAPADRARAVLIYDGTWGLCRGGVSWLSRRAVTGHFEFLPCQAAERRARYPWMDEHTCLQAMQLILPDGRELFTLRDAAQYITALPKAEHDAADWQVAMETLLLVAERDGPEMLARIAVTKALNRTGRQ